MHGDLICFILYFFAVATLDASADQVFWTTEMRWVQGMAELLCSMFGETIQRLWVASVYCIPSPSFSDFPPPFSPPIAYSSEELSGSDSGGEQHAVAQ
ncbi:hypothetical protein BD289DRAFT_428188 [Coniella lustricola]|uniref:Secreted protein n=1 Tax=Coniella lustricola TaxID=2025994 RepID=A0A2T3AEE0_9PEZI|nr:hypothetical protein BD289DRAFT_428188 [Coniella lustricola]